MESKKSSGILVVILVLVVIALSGYIAYDKLLVKTDNSDKNNAKYEKVVEITNKDSILFYQGLIDNMFYNLDQNIEQGVIFSSDKVLLSDLTLEQKLKLAYQNVDYRSCVLAKVDGTEDVSENCMKKAYNKLFNSGYKSGDFKTDLLDVKYDSKITNEYKYIVKKTPTDFVGEYEKMYHTNNSVKKYALGKVVIEENVYFIKFNIENSSEKMRVTFYTDASLKTELKDIPSFVYNLNTSNEDLEDYTKKYIEKYKEYAPKYKVTFKLNEETNEYNFYSSERIK